MRLALTGDVMLGRGVDQILGHPGDPTIHEEYARSALRYVELAEARSGSLPRQVDPSYVWGDILPILRELAPDVTIVNLETAVTDRGLPWPGKGIHYRMHPANIDCLTAAGVDVAVLANNHVLDWSLPGLTQTLDTIGQIGVTTAGAGRTAEEAWAPAVVSVAKGNRVLVWAVGSPSSGIPSDWGAAGEDPGVALIPDLSDSSVDRIGGRVAADATPGDLVVVSIHWGENWGYEIGRGRRRFAHRLVERAGVHVVHGHSSHHPLGLEIHHGRLILYGCGDLVTDYEGIPGHEHYRGELGAVYLPLLDPSSGELVGLELIPTTVNRFRLTRPSLADRQWVTDVLTRESEALGTPVEFSGDDVLRAEWRPG